MRSRRDRPGYGSLSKQARPVWVNLEALFTLPTDLEGAVPGPDDALHLAGEVPGGLWDWVRTSHGCWLAVITFHIDYCDVGRDRFIADRQLVPAYALRPR